MRIEVLKGAGLGSLTSGVQCVGPCVSLRVHIVAVGTATGPVVVKQGEISNALKTVQTVTNPVGGDNWITLSPSEFIEVTSNLTAGSLETVVIAWVPENVD